MPGLVKIIICQLAGLLSSMFITLVADEDVQLPEALYVYSKLFQQQHACYTEYSVIQKKEKITYNVMYQYLNVYELML
jgi:hypothetical protein